MAINKAMKLALKALSYPEFDLRTSRRLVSLKEIDPLKGFYYTMDEAVFNGEYEVPIRIYLPDEGEFLQWKARKINLPALLFIHGGGWVTESVDTYNRICRNMARSTGHLVVSVDYRLAPEHRFPVGLEDCYAVAKAIFTRDFLPNINTDSITVIGDSAGGNLAAALCLMAKDRGEFIPQRQILIYPCTNNDYSENSKFLSMHENGNDYLLTRKNLYDYMELYKRTDEDLKNPYFAPLMSKDLSDLPRTLIITAEYDPLRDEGEAFGSRLKDAGNEVEIHRIPDALHGYFALSTRYIHVKKTYELINKFLQKGISDV